jgi:hypothetical protein
MRNAQDREMRPLARVIFFCIALCLAALAKPAGLCAVEAPDGAEMVDKVINKVIDVYGGKEAVANMHSLRVKGDIEAFVLKDRGTYEVYFKEGRKLRVETKYARSAEFRILNGDRGYRGTKALAVEEVYGARYYAMVYHYKHLNILSDIVKGTYHISYVGLTSVHDAAVEIFTFKDKEGAVMDVYIDARDFLILKVTGYFLEMKKKIGLSVEFSDFKKVDGLLLPFRVINYAGGRKIAQTVIEKYFLNQDIPDSLFEPTALQSL